MILRAVEKEKRMQMSLAYCIVMINDKITLKLLKLKAFRQKTCYLARLVIVSANEIHNCALMHKRVPQKNYSAQTIRNNYQ